MSNESRVHYLHHLLLVRIRATHSTWICSSQRCCPSATTLFPNALYAIAIWSVQIYAKWVPCSLASPLIASRNKNNSQHLNMFTTAVLLFNNNFVSERALRYRNLICTNLCQMSPVFTSSPPIASRNKNNSQHLNMFTTAVLLFNNNFVS